MTESFQLKVQCIPSYSRFICLSRFFFRIRGKIVALSTNDHLSDLMHSSKKTKKRTRNSDTFRRMNIYETDEWSRIFVYLHQRSSGKLLLPILSTRPCYSNFPGQVKGNDSNDNERQKPLYAIIFLRGRNFNGGGWSFLYLQPRPTSIYKRRHWDRSSRPLAPGN